MTQSGLTPFTNDEVPNIVVPSLSAQTISFAFFPDWFNDAGVQSFGGAAVVSIFEDGATEGTSTSNVTAITNAVIATIGGVVLPSPSAAVVYKVRIRLRAAVGDANYVDRVVRFRVVTPTLAPFNVVYFAANQEPDVTFVSGEWKFATTVGTFPAGEIKLQDGLGGIVLPNAAGVAWSSDAAAFLTATFNRLRSTVFAIDFAPAGGTESVMRILYHATWNAATSSATVTKYRRRDFGTWGYFTGSEVDFIEAAVDMVAGTASVTFVRGLYAVGPRFQALWIIGDRGTMPINPHAVQVGQQIDVSQVVSFDKRSHLSTSGLADKFLTLCCITGERIYLREIPLRPTGWWDFVAQDGVTNYNASQFNPPLVAQPILGCRVLFDDYIEFPNLTQYYDPSVAFLVSPTTLPYPRVQNIRIHAENAVTANVVYTDVVDLHNQMYGVRMPEIGVQRSVLDRRHLRQDATPFTAIPSNTAFLKILCEIKPDASTPAYEVEAYYDMNFSGQPGSWKLSESGTPVAVPDAPALAWDAFTHTLSIVLDTGTAVDDAALTLRGDVGSFIVSDIVTVNNPGTTTVPAANLRTIMSVDCEFLELEYTVTAVGTFCRRVAVTTANLLVTGDVSNVIDAYFTGASLIFRDVSAVIAEADGTKSVTVVGDGPPLVLRNVVTTTPQFLNFQGTTPLAAGIRQTYVDLLYMAGSPAALHRYRVYNTFHDARSGNPRALLLSGLSLWGAAGTDYEHVNFSAPALQFDLGALTVSLQDDSRVYDFRAWRLENPRTGEKCEFWAAPTAGVAYAVGPVLFGAQVNDVLLFVALHRSGTQKVFTVLVQPSTAGYATPRAVSLRGNL